MDGGTKIRILQWNVLADGLGSDGFLSTEYSHVWESSDADAKHYSAEDFVALVRKAKQADTERDGVLKSLKDAKKREKELAKMNPSDKGYDDLKAKIAKIYSHSELMKLKHQFKNSPQLKLAENEILDWNVRYNRIKEIVLSADPDIITFQEMDHLEQFQKDKVFSAKYTCLVDDQKMYKPARYADGNKKDDVDTKDDLRPDNYLHHVIHARTAFAPKAYSHARNLRDKRHPKTPHDLDDDGVAVFWKKEILYPIELGFLKWPSESEKSQAVLAVTLEHIATNKRINVLTTHLPSGDDATKEQERLGVMKNPNAEWCARRIRFDKLWYEVDYEPKEGFDGITSYVKHFTDRKKIDSSTTIFALDANSRPSYPFHPDNVWKTILDSTKLQSIWVQNSYLTLDGKCVDPRYEYIASVNKMRGPSSDQPAKIGEHMLELIDHVFTNANASNICNEVKVNKDVTVSTAPLIYESKEGPAEVALYPSSTMPSDHCPVIVDITL